MRADALIEVIAALGCTVRLDGKALAIDGPHALPEALMALVKAHKAALVQALKSPASWTAADWRAHFHERAAILEHDAGLKRAHAEEEALTACFHLFAGRPFA